MLTPNYEFDQDYPIPIPCHRLDQKNIQDRGACPGDSEKIDDFEA